MKRKNALVFLLLILALAIWGHNVYRVVLSLQQADEEQIGLSSDANWPQADAALPQPNQTEKFVYRAVGRDPFAHRLFEHKEPVTKPSNKRSAIRANEQEPPRLR